MDDNLPKSYPEPEEVEPSVLKVRGKTLIYENTIYQINNITSISLIEVKNTKKRTRHYSIMRLIGAILLIFIAVILLQSPNKNFQIFGLLLIIVDILLLCHYRPNKTSQQYGLVIEGNSGYKNIIVSSSKRWIQRIIIELWFVMNAGTDKLKPSTFNFNDYSINGSNINSPTLLDNTIQGNLDVNVVDIV
ncbi:MAG: hypothetical protein F6K25_11980 [Okeania sp. SIO2G4]|uniref:DUF6232 family protein n=1 Tax=unclassified Okeania TaxID=2634635 RepID=UPI0013BA61D6|nr:MULTISPECIES: DUF6232 family protein [unclassified Okeania]NEP38068.1 hypothetical protein [Okeania sp. SIO2H7]NEP72741.1 hypothetical protein [Okeania sp. SIO2G5]NEP93375.1 hypothetical protein [Okeania sp. SIO2F5]NEQ91387.1 hypothetical protein [Okeania sp. SIO2G4]